MIIGHMTRLLILLTLLLLAACDAGESDNVTYVVITGEAPAVGQNVQQSTPPATALPPTPTAIPATATPDMPPEVALQIADRYLLDGYYENAVFGYQAILNRGDTAPPDVRAAAAYGMAQAALREGLFQNAVDATTTLINLFPGDFRAVQAYFLRGDAYLGLSQWQAAIDDFRQYMTLRPGVIDSYAHERIGDAQLALEQFDAAFTSYEQAAQADRTIVPQLALREKIARLYLLSGQTEQAIQQYDAILAVAQNNPYRAQIEFLTGQAHLDAGNLDSGLARMRRIVLQYEDRPEAYQALEILLQNDTQIDAYRQGRVNYFSGDYAAAIDAFNTFTTQTALADIPAELHLFLGRAYRAVGNSDAALVAFQTLIDQYPTDPLFGEALLETGRTRFLNDDLEDAINTYLQVAANYDYLPDTAAEALWRAGYLHSTLGNYTDSAQIFQQLAQEYPDSTQASSGLFIAASAALNADDTFLAETLYSQLASTTTGEDQAEALLQIGRLAQERGDQAAAEEALNRAAVVAPDTYFSARAQDIIAGRAPFTPPDQLVFEFDDVADVTAAENWLRETFGITQEGPLWPLSPQLEGETRLIRGRELWAVGAFNEAEDEFYSLLDAYSSDGLASYQLSIFLRILGSYTPSMVGAANIIRAAGLSTLDAPAYIARLRYPAYYRDVILRTAEQYDLDPLLIMSQIRHESLFNTNADGAAAEKGLTQVIPSTAEYIAGQINWPDYQHSDLYRPYAGIEFGAYYLDEQMRRFDGNTYAALAGYNAGPGRAIQWLDIAGEDPDAFMSAITIDSVQLYIQLTYRNYNIYRALYGA